MISISLCMIVKNEEDVIARCLKCVEGIVDEIIIVDTGSTDNTKKIVSEFTDLIYDFKWIDDFSAARNYSFSKATKEYILWLDADDVIDEKNQKKLLKLKKNLDKNVDVVMMKYHTAFDENQNPTNTYERERLVKRKNNYIWNGEIHEVIYPWGTIIHSDIEVLHKKLHPTEPKRNLNIFEKMIKNGKKFDARQQYYYCRELYYNKLYEKAIKEFNIYLAMNDGWIEDKIDACKLLSYCYEAINKVSLVLPALYLSFNFDRPRAEICCEIGRHLMNDEKYEPAIFWFELALSFNVKNQNGFIQTDCYNFTPFLQLCVCYYKLGDYNKAVFYNEKAGEVKPSSKSYLYNKKFFKEFLK